MRKSQEVEIKVTLALLTPRETDILIEPIVETLMKAIIAGVPEKRQRQETIRQADAEQGNTSP